jgi:hypothetical protein
MRYLSGYLKGKLTVVMDEIICMKEAIVKADF